MQIMAIVSKLATIGTVQVVLFMNIGFSPARYCCFPKQLTCINHSVLIDWVVYWYSLEASTSQPFFLRLVPYGFYLLVIRAESI